MYITIPCGTATWPGGWIGRGAVQRSIWRKQVLRGEAYLAGVSVARLRKGLGRTGDVRPHECGTPNLSRACVRCAPFFVIASRPRAEDCAPCLLHFPSAVRLLSGASSLP